MALETVATYITQLRFLMQDADGVRYTDDAVLNAIKNGLTEIRRVRSDIFFGITVPEPIATNSSLTALPEMARVALLYYACAYAETSDQESTDTGRAIMYGQRFAAQMVSMGGQV